MTPTLIAGHPTFEPDSPSIEKFGVQPADDLTALARRIVATWPALSPERKAELGRLLAT
jgi:hypothetical protein